MFGSLYFTKVTFKVNILKYLHIKQSLKLVDLEINKGINDEYLQYGNSTTKWPFYTFF